jgi:hypothetical protein
VNGVLLADVDGDEIRARFVVAEERHTVLPDDLPVRGDLEDACVVFGVSQFSEYVPYACNWVGPGFWGVVLVDGGVVAAGDRTYAWNENPSPSRLSWVNWADLNNPSVPVLKRRISQFEIPAYSWTWTSVLSGGPFRAELDIEQHPGFLGGLLTGYLGLTDHHLVQLVK